MGCKDSREAKTTAETLCQEVSKEAQDGFRSLSSAALDHCAVDLWLEQVAFCEVLMGSDISLPWVHLALTLPRMQLGRTSMTEQINSPKLHCVRKTKQFCPHNETVAVLQDLPPQYTSWLAAKQEVLNSRVKREDVEG